MKFVSIVVVIFVRGGGAGASAGRARVGGRVNVSVEVKSVMGRTRRHWRGRSITTLSLIYPIWSFS